VNGDVKRTAQDKRRRQRLTVVIVGILVVLLLAVREHFDPFLILFIDDIVNPKPPPATLALTDELTLLLYSDTRPHIGKIDLLQKGLVLVDRGKRLIEEGYGFGLPIIKYGDLPHNSRHAEVVQVDEHTLVKRYTIDTADRWSRFLQVKYKAVEPLGTVVCTYTVTLPDTISVTVDFTGLSVAWDKAYLMNEQGARSFPIYENSAGERQHGDALGIWHPEDDVWGCWLTGDETLRFCVETEPGRRRFVGRERYNQYNWVAIYTLSWSGIDIEIDEPATHYTYTIRVQRLP